MPTVWPDADRLAYAASPAIRLWRLLVTYTGVLPLVRFIAAIISRVFAKSAADAPEASRQRMASLLKEGAQSGAISEQQLTLLDQAFALREATVGDEMIPWARVHKLDASMTRPQALRFIQRYPASRFPVVGDRASGNRALVLGVVEHLDLCTADDAAPSIANLARPAPLLTPTTPVREALRL
ncbi:MAG: hypothetical protein MUE97_08015, partial [Phycisphaerales bacterium]|nr:hypothetical protein [Phycisphaerales bacterium]